MAGGGGGGRLILGITITGWGGRDLGGGCGRLIRRGAFSVKGTSGGGGGGGGGEERLHDRFRVFLHVRHGSLRRLLRVRQGFQPAAGVAPPSTAFTLT